MADKPFDLVKMLAQAPFVLWAVDADGKLAFASGGLFLDSKVHPTLYVGKMIEDIAKEESNPLLAEWARRALRGDTFTVIAPFRGKLLEIRCAPYLDGKTIIGAYSFATDITAYRLAQEDHEMLASLVTNSDDAIIGKTLQGMVISWNNGAEKLYGYTAEEAIGKNVADLIIPPDRRIEFTMIMTSIKKGEPVPASVTERVCKDGRRIYVSVSISPMRNASGQVNGASAVARDVTQEWWLQRENEAVIYIGSVFQKGGELREILRRIPPMLASQFHLPIVTIEIFAPDTMEMVLVASQGLSVRPNDPPTRMPLEQSACGAAFKRGEPLLETLRITQLHYNAPAPVTIDAKAFVCVPIMVDGKPYGALTAASPKRVSLDVSLKDVLHLIGGVIGQHMSRDATERRIRESEDRLRAVIDNSSDIILRAAPTALVTDVSAAVERILGYTPKEFVAKSGYDYIHPDDLAMSQHVHAKLLETDQMQQAVIRLRRTDGQYVPLEMRLRSIHDASGKVSEIVVVARDVSERTKT